MPRGNSETPASDYTIHWESGNVATRHVSRVNFLQGEFSFHPTPALENKPIRSLHLILGALGVSVKTAAEITGTSPTTVTDHRDKARNLIGSYMAFNLAEAAALSFDNDIFRVTTFIPSPKNLLSPRETAVLHYTSTGLETDSIRNRVKVHNRPRGSNNLVKNSWQKIYEKSGTNNRAAGVTWGYLAGILPSVDLPDLNPHTS